MNLSVLSTYTARRRYADDFIVVYLDTCVDEVNLAQLSQLEFLIKSFIDPKDCVDFIASLDDKQVFCLLADQLVEHHIRSISQSPSIKSIYIISTNKRGSDYHKAKGVYGDILEIIEAIKADAQLVQRDSTPLAILSPVASFQRKNGLNVMFMYCELLKETFLQTVYGRESRRPLIDFCKGEYEDNTAVLCVIDEFERDYEKHLPTWWYTRECFIYRMLNKALRTCDIEVIIKFGFFIKDLHHQLEVLHQNLSTDQFILYRGQGMSNEEFAMLEANVGGLISFHSFLSTSINRDFSCQFALSSLDVVNMKAILFVIHVDLTLTSNPIGYLNGNLSCIPDEEEYLWDMNSIFRIDSVVKLPNDLYQIDLTVTNEDDSQLRQLMEYMRQESGILSGIQRLGNLMIEMGQWDKAKDIYETLLQDKEDPCVIQQLGFIAHQTHDFDQALRYYQRSLHIFLNTLSPNDSRLATLYSNIGCVLKDKGDFEEAHEQFQHALELERNVENPNNENIARIRSNIVTLLEKQGHYKEAIENIESSLEVLRVHLPPTHPEIAASYSNIATLYYQIEDYPNALISYEKCRDIQQACLPAHHPDLERTNLYMKRTMAIIQQRDRGSRQFILETASNSLTRPNRQIERQHIFYSIFTCRFLFLLTCIMIGLGGLISVITKVTMSTIGAKINQGSTTSKPTTSDQQGLATINNVGSIPTKIVRSKLHSRAWKLVGNMSFSRRQHTAIYVPEDESVVIIGGFNFDGQSRNTMEKFFPSCNCFKKFGRNFSMDHFVRDAILLDGNILLTIGPMAGVELLDSIKGTPVWSSPKLEPVNASFLPIFVPISD